MPPLERTLQIVNTHGLHARPAAQLVQAATRFRCEVFLEKDGIRVNAKSIMGVLTLAAPTGSEILVSCEGDDADKALEALARIFEGGFGER